MIKCDFCDKQAIHFIEYENITRMNGAKKYSFCSFHLKLKIKQIIKKYTPDNEEN